MKIVNTLVTLFGDMDYSKLGVYFSFRGALYRMHAVQEGRIHYFKEHENWDSSGSLGLGSSLRIVKVERTRGIRTKVILYIT